MGKNTKTVPGGLVIMFEGIDGAGKTTQINLLKKDLEEAGWSVTTTRNLGGTPIGEALRDVMKSKLERPPMTDFHISLAIQEPLIEVIGKARDEGSIVLMDRGPLSLAAYQIYGSGIEESVGMPQVQTGMDRIRPDAIILYDTDPVTALGRLGDASKESDYFESKPADYFHRVADGFRQMADRFGAVTVDAAQPVGAVQERTAAVVQELLAKRT